MTGDPLACLRAALCEAQRGRFREASTWATRAVDLAHARAREASPEERVRNEEITERAIRLQRASSTLMTECVVTTRIMEARWNG